MEKNKTLITLIIYHRTDFDGKCSAAIAKKVIPNADFYGWNYGDPIDWELIKLYNQVVMVDVSFPTIEDMIKINEAVNEFIWIDHHDTAIKKYKDLKLKGIQKNGDGACVHTWRYFFNEPVPKGVQLLGDYDIWNHSDPDTLPFQYGMRFFNVKANEDSVWNPIFDENGNISEILNIGKTCLMYQREQNEKRARHAFELEFEGLKFLTLNHPPIGSLVFESVEDINQYDAQMTFSFNGQKSIWMISMYKIKDGIHLGEIAQKYGGGGHKGAAGFSCKELPFKFMEKINES